MSIIKLDKHGEYEWFKWYENRSLYSTGNNVCQNENDDFIITSHVSNYGTADVSLIKLNSMGELLSNNYIKNKEDLFVYPNPSDGNLKVESVESIEEIKIVNAIGEIIYFRNFECVNNVEISLSNIDDGVYIYYIKTHTRELKTGKLIIY